MNYFETIKKILAGIALLLCVVLPMATFAQDSAPTPINYVPLVDLPGTGTSNAPGATVELSTYLPGIFKLSIAIAGALAVIMIVYGGVEYLSTDAISGKSEGKEKITNALIGLLLAIGSFIILNTINPATVEFDLTIKRPAALTPSQGNGTPPSGDTSNTCIGKTGSQVSCSCPTCSMLAGSNLPLKPGQGNQLDSGLIESLKKLNTELEKESIIWQITEVWKPTVSHQNDCHRNGTCIDANIRSQVNATTIKKFITLAKAQGLRPVYEVKTWTKYNELINAGVPVENLARVTAITAAHFSVYK